MAVSLTNIIVPIDTEIGVISKASFEYVEAEWSARFHVRWQALAQWTLTHPHCAPQTFPTCFQLWKYIRAYKRKEKKIIWVMVKMQSNFLETYRLHFSDDIASSVERLGEGARGDKRSFDLDWEFLWNVTEWFQFFHMRVDTNQIPVNARKIQWIC